MTADFAAGDYAAGGKAPSGMFAQQGDDQLDGVSETKSNFRYKTL